MGEAFLPTLRQALDQIDQATEAIVTSARKRTVVVSCPMSLAENWLAGLHGRVSQGPPEIEIVLHGTIWEDLSEQIADITISTRRFDDRPPAGVPLWNEELALLCAPALLEGESAVKAPPDIFKVDWIFVHGRQEYWQYIAAALGIDMGDYDKGLTTNASNIALELAAMGAGLVATQRLSPMYLQRGLLWSRSRSAGKSMELLSHGAAGLEGQDRAHGAGVDSFARPGRFRLGRFALKCGMALHASRAGSSQAKI